MGCVMCVCVFSFHLPTKFLFVISKLVGANHPHLVATLCSSFGRENGYPLLICSSRYAQPSNASKQTRHWTPTSTHWNLHQENLPTKIFKKLEAPSTFWSNSLFSCTLRWGEHGEHFVEPNLYIGSLWKLVDLAVKGWVAFFFHRNGHAGHFPWWKIISLLFTEVVPTIAYFMGILAAPPKANPPRNKALLRVY